MLHMKRGARANATMDVWRRQIGNPDLSLTTLAYGP